MNETLARPSGRTPGQLRNIRITRRYTKHAEGSVLIECGDTKVICTASVLEKVPGFLKDRGQGWLTAEYGMLPRSTHTRTDREAARGKQSGRTQEIQRLIGRSLRAVVDLDKLGARTLHLDCDVIQADGGTRTAAITGAFVALHDSVNLLLERQLVAVTPILDFAAAVSVGIHEGRPVLDLDYAEDAPRSLRCVTRRFVQRYHRQKYHDRWRRGYSMEALIFYSLAAVMVISSLMVILRKNPVHSALFLILSFLCLAGIFLQLNEPQFIAAVQVIVYATGAIMGLFLFVIMLLNVEREASAGDGRGLRKFGALCCVWPSPFPSYPQAP